MTNSGPGLQPGAGSELRPDANRLAMRVARSILAATHDFDFELEGKTVHVVAEALPSPPWPTSGLDGLDQAADGPWPSAVRLRCRWEGGEATLLMEASFWRGQNRYRHMVGLRVFVPSVRRELLWITLAKPLGSIADGSDVVLEASFTPFRKRVEQEDPGFTRAHQIKEIVERAGLPLHTGWRLEACTVLVPSLEIKPSAEEVFERLAKVSLLKMPFFLRGTTGGFKGDPPFEISDSSEDEPAPSPPPPTGKRAGIWPLPGGVREYKKTLDALLEALAAEPMTVIEFDSLLEERYEVTGDASRRAYRNILIALSLATLLNDRLTLTPEALAYLGRRDAADLFDRLHNTYLGLLEVLVIAREVGHATSERTADLLKRLLDVEWKTSNQVSFRRNWLVSLGMTERTETGDTLTPLGRAILERHKDEVSSIDAHLSQILEEAGPDALDVGPDDPDDRDEVVAPGLDLPKPWTSVEPTAWAAARVDLPPNKLAEKLSGLAISAGTVAALAAAISAGKHILLVGPPGTGKTDLAHCVVEAARAEGYCAGAFVATASADWTTFDTIGGYAIQRDGVLKFRSGALLRAIETWQWLIIDEINRADVDRAFGELMTVLAGKTTDTSYELPDGRNVRIGPDPTATHPMPRTFRVIATMNTWDKTSLFRLSYAVQRRFAIVQVGIPDDAVYARLIQQHASGDGLDPAVEDSALPILSDFFSSRGILAIRPLGPAVALDLIRYLRRRQASGDGLAEGLAMYVLPQLEGLDEAAALKAYGVLLGAVEGWSSAASRVELRERFGDLFPHVRLPVE